MPTRSIHMSGQDIPRLRHLIAARSRTSPDDRQHLETLAAELDRATVVSEELIPADVITMRSRVRVRDLVSGASSEYTLAYPWDADVASNQVSVLAPLGTALLGYRENDEIAWPTPGGVRRLRVEKILYQPEAASRAARPIEANVGAYQEYQI